MIIHSLLQTLDRVQNEKLEGQAIRARINWRAEGEKSTAYFYRTLKTHQAKAQMSEIVHPTTGQLCTSTNDILTATTSFYQDLFTPTENQPSSIQSSLNPHLPICLQRRTSHVVWKAYPKKRLSTPS